MEELVKYTEQEGVTRLFLEVRASNEPAIHLYQNMGFVQTGIRKNYYEEPREDGIMMMRECAAR